MDLVKVAHSESVAVEDLIEPCLAVLPDAADERRARAKPVNHRQLVAVAMS